MYKTQKNNCPFKQAFEFFEKMDRYEEHSSKVSIFVGVYENNTTEKLNKLNSIEEVNGQTEYTGINENTD